MTGSPAPQTATERVSISCPGCGRHDFVNWPVGQDVLKWKCFNCEKESLLQRHGRH